MKIRFYDKSLGQVETSQGTMKLPGIFIPMFLEFFLMNLMSTVNTFMLSYHSQTSVAAVGSAGQFMAMATTFYTMVSTGASIYMGQMIGAGKEKEASDAAFCSISFVAVLSLVISTVLSFHAGSMMALMNIKDDVLLEATSYFHITIQFSFLAATDSILYAIFKSYGRPKISVFIGIVMNGINAALNYLVIFRPLDTFSIDFPLKGITGIAWSYCISEVFALACAILVLHHLALGLNFRRKSFRTFKVTFKVLRIGIPGGISTFSYNISQVVTTSIVATLGVNAISTKIYVSTLAYYVYMTGMSLGLATSLMISWLCGAKKFDQAYRLNLQNLRIAVVLNALLSSLLFLFGEPLLGLFSNDPEILRMGKLLLLIDIFVEIFRGFNHIEENSLRGAGDVVFPMAVSMVSCWLMSVLFSYILGIHFGLGLAGCWIAFGMDEMFRGLNYLHRWRSKKWMEKSQGLDSPSTKIH